MRLPDVPVRVDEARQDDCAARVDDLDVSGLTAGATAAMVPSTTNTSPTGRVPSPGLASSSSAATAAACGAADRSVSERAGGAPAA
ncbi:MAG: hypothetical protein ACRERC_19280, partial [Candidatus Binatia bacterium]